MFYYFKIVFPIQVKEWYQRHNTLPFPPNCRKEMETLIEECWNADQDNRKRPQAIVRDVNQILYEGNWFYFKMVSRSFYNYFLLIWNIFYFWKRRYKVW